MGMRRRIVAAAICLCAAGSLATVLSGCEEDIAGVRDLDTPFSLYGFIDPTSDTQYVRVFPIVERLEPSRTEPLDAHFTSIDLNTDELHTWQDSLVQYDDGTSGHVFWAPFRAVPGHEYRLRVERSDGAQTYVEVDVPAELSTIRQTPFIRADQRGNPIAVVEPVLLKGGTPRLLGLEVEYLVKYDTGSESVAKVAVPYGDRQEATSDGWMVEVDLRWDFASVGEELFRRDLWTSASSYGIYVLLVTLKADVVNESWAFPGGEVDPNVLIEPGTFSNVENGFGFVGSGYPLRRSWRPREESIVATRFTVCPCEEVFCDYHPSCPGPYQ